jgi:predicted aspartyl protease
MAKTAARNSLVGYNLPLWSAGWFHKCPMILAAAAIVASFGSNLQAASSQSRPSVNERVEVFSSAEETATLIETVNDGASLTPMAEIMGAGGVKWFMIKTPAGNVGWIKASENSAARQVDGHFRALPKESTSISPAGNSPDSLVKTSSQGKATIPIQVRGRHIIVAVTFNDSVTGNLVLDTGAGQTMISKRIANDLRLYSTGAGTRIGVGGAVSVSTANIDAIRVGDADVKNMRVSIHDLPFNAFEEGLLGMDFLGHFQMSLDIEKRVLILAPRKG